MNLLHVAVLHGNFYATDYLINLGVSPYIKSLSSDGKEEDNCLDISCRWDYLEIFKLLIHKVKWTTSQLAKAKVKTTNKEIMSILSSSRKSMCCYIR
jgi:hypothetical protein